MLVTHGSKPPTQTLCCGSSNGVPSGLYGIFDEISKPLLTSRLRKTLCVTFEDAMFQAVAMTVLIFVSIDCPVSNRYAPEIKRLHEEFTSRGVSFRLVYPNPLDDEAAIGRHLRGLRLSADRRTRCAITRW